MVCGFESCCSHLKLLVFTTSRIDKNEWARLQNCWAAINLLMKSGVLYYLIKLSINKITYYLQKSFFIMFLFKQLCNFFSTLYVLLNKVCFLVIMSIATETALMWYPKACVHYFLVNFYFQPNDSPSKMFFIFKVYDVINCLNKNLIIHFAWCLGKEKRYDIETLSIDRVLNKEHFYGKTMPKMWTKS